MDWVLALVFFSWSCRWSGWPTPTLFIGLAHGSFAGYRPASAFALGKHLYRTQWDAARDRDHVAMARNSLRKEAGRPVEGEVPLRQ